MFALDPDHLPIVGGQIAVSAADLMSMVMAAAPACVALPPACDAVSLLFPVATATHVEYLATTTVEGIAYQHGASATLPTVGASYSGTDIFDGGAVVSSMPLGG